MTLCSLVQRRKGDKPQQVAVLIHLVTFFSWKYYHLVCIHHFICIEN